MIISYLHTVKLWLSGMNWEVEEHNHNLFQGTILAFVWVYRGKSQKNLGLDNWPSVQGLNLVPPNYEIIMLTI
jgi:hypothetical protein